MDRQHPDSPMDPLTDPNFIMAMGLMNNIKVDNLNVLTNRTETLAEAQKREEQRKAEEAAKKAAQDTLTKERTPVEKIVDKLQDKRILTRQEVTAITLSLSKEFSSDLKNKSPELVQQYLSFAYYVVLNIQPFSHGRNYLENQSLLKLLKELFNVIKLFLEFITSKKETSGAPHLAALMNSFLPISFKILALFQLPSSSTQLSHFDMMHYKYLRSTHVKALAAGQLQASLNPMLKEFLVAEQKSAVSASNETVIIEVAKQATAEKVTNNNEDFIMNTLEFVPSEYSIMAKSLQDQVHSTFVQQNDDNMSINDEEEKEEGKIENIDNVIKELINKQKLSELYAKAVDRLVQEEELYLQVDSSLFSVVKQYLSKLPQIKSKHFNQFITKTVCDRAIKTQQAIIEHFNKLKDVEAMQIDQIEQGEIKELQENTRILAKCLEICPDDTAFIIEIVKGSGSLKYLSKLINVDRQKETMSSMIESITLSYCNNLQILLSDGFLHSLEPQQLHDIIVILFRMVIITRDINTKKKEDGSQKLFKQASVMPQISNKHSEAQNTPQKSVRTRGQAKRQRQDESSTLPEFKEEKKHDDIIQMALVNVDVSDLLKTSISMLASSLPFFIKVHNKVQLSADFLKNLIRLAQNHSSVISSLITGILSEFTKPTLCYDKFSITQIGKILHDHLQQILLSPCQTIIAIKLMFQISNSKSPLYDKEIAIRIAKELIANGKWLPPKQNEIQNIASPQNVTRFIMLLACLFSVNQNAGDDLQNQRQILARLAQDQIDSLDFGLQLQVLQMTLFSTQSMGILKINLMKFMTALFNESDLGNLINSLSSEINFQLNGMISNTQAVVFDKQLQGLLKDKLSINYFLDLLIKNFEGFLSQSKQGDLKTHLLALLKKFTFICVDKDGQQISPKVDLQTYIQNSCSNMDLLFSQYDMHVKTTSQAVLTKLQAKTALSEEEAEFINSSMRSLIELSKAYLEESIRAIKNKVATIDPNCQNVDIHANIIYESTKCIQNPFGINKCLSQCLDLQSMSLKPDEIILQRIGDPQGLTKTIYNLRGNQQSQLKLEDTIYAHCFSSFTDNMKPDAQQLQRTTSQQLMLRSLYQCLSKFVQYDSVANVQQIAIELHRISTEIPFLEYSDNVGGSFDNDTSDKIFNRIVNGKQSTLVSNKEFQKFKSFDHVLNLLVQSKDILQSSASLQSLVAEVTSQTPLFTQFIKSSADFKGIINYLHTEDSDAAKFLKPTLPYSQKLGDNLPVQIWSLALSYIEMTMNQASVEVKTEKKGGMQMVIELDQPKKQEPPKGMSTRQKKRAVKFAKDNTHEEAKQQPSSSQEATEAQPQPQKVQKILNPIALKLVNFMIDIMSTNAQSIVEQKNLAESLRMAFGSLGSQTVNLVERLYETKQVVILKSLVGSLIKTTDHQIQANLTNAIVHFLHQSKGYAVDKRLESLLLSLELAEFVTVNNQELASFISSQLLDHSSDFFSTHESQLTKLQILDFMCQLAMSKYVQDQKYAAQQIYNLRKQNREEIKKMQDLQKIELAKTLSEQVENQAESMFGIQKSKTHPDNIEVEGFKQERLVQGDKESLKYMEWPEEYCTYSITKKVFREQHWYVCYTCGLKDNSGCCGVCVKKCHKGHAVAYCKRTNFFCDCGDSGRCKCLNRELQQQPSQQPSAKEPAQLFNGRENPFQPRNEPLFQPFQPISSGERNLFGQPRPIHPPIGHDHGFLGRSDSPKYIPNMIQDEFSDEANNDFKEFLRRQQQRLEQGDHSSEDDLDAPGNGRIGQSIKSVMKLIKKGPDRLEPDNGYDNGASMFQQQQLFGRPPIFGAPPHFRDVNEIHQDFRDRPFGVLPHHQFQNQPPPFIPPHHRHQSLRSELQPEQSHIEPINPLEDPFSEAGMDTIDHNQMQLGFSQSNLGILPSGGDIEMKQEIQVEQLIPEVVSFIQAQSSHFQEVYSYLCTALTDSLTKSQQSQSQDQLMVEESKQPISSGNFEQRLNDFLNIPKEKLSLVQDQVQYKKVINQGQFQVKLQNDNSIRPAMQNSINLVNIVDSNKNGLVAICEDQEVCFYAGSQFFEDAASANKDQEIFKFQHKDGNNISKIDTQRVSFPPLQVLFNEVQPQYLAVAGPQNVEVVVLQKNGKVDYKISLDLMLETFGRDLTILNIRWLPGSQTSLAVGTRDFIKIYDLGLDILSPTHNIMIFNGFVTDFAFSQNPKVNANQAETTLFATSRSGQVFYMNINYTLNSFEVKQEGEKMHMDQDNSDMMMTEALSIDNKLLKFKDNQTQALSVYCTSQNIILLTFNEGLTLVGTRDPNSGVFHGFRVNVQEDQSFNSSNCKTVWQKHGESMCGFREIVPFTPNRRDQKLVLLGYSRKFGNNQIASHGIPLMIEIKETKLIVNVVKNSQIGSSSNNMVPVIGQAYVRKSHRGSNQMRLVNVMVDSGAATYFCKTIYQERDNEEEKQVQDPMQKIENDIKLAHGNVDVLISKSDLPHEAQMCHNFFEKTRSFIKEQNICLQLNFTGDILTTFRNLKATQEILARSLGQNSAIIQEASKKNYKFTVSLDPTSDYVITGLRLRLDYSPYRQKEQYITLKLFNREQKLQNYIGRGHGAPILFDVPFCDAEVLFGTSSTNQNLTFEFQTEDPKQVPIRIVSIDVQGLTKKEFMYREKMRKLERLNAERLKKSLSSLMVIPSNEVLNDQLVRDELLDTRQLPIVAAREKFKYLSGQIDKNEVEAVIAIDILTQYLSMVQPSQLGLDMGQLLQKLQSQLSPDNSLNKFELAAVKRCIKKIISVVSPQAGLGHPHNYQTIKDMMLLSFVKKRLEQKDFTMEQFRMSLRALMKVNTKRFYHVFKMIEDSPLLVSQMIEAYIDLKKKDTSNSSKQQQQDICDLVGLIVANYQFRVNQSLDQFTQIEDVINAIYSDETFTEVFSLLKPLLDHEDEQVQKLTISSIMNIATQYSKTLQVSLKKNKVPIVKYNGQTHKIVLVDFCPHLISYAFNLIASGNCDIGYQLAFKMTRSFEANCLKNYEGKFTQQIVNRVVKFISSQVFLQIKPSQLLISGDTSTSVPNRNLYANLILSNIFLHHPQQDDNIKIKSINLGLDQSIQKKIIESLTNDQALLVALVEWTQGMIQAFAKEFVQQRCSYRTKFDEGIPGKVYQVLNNQGNAAAGGGRQLLRPFVETVAWKWHPIFLKSDTQFDLLDRKIPVQIMMLVNFLISQAEQLDKYDEASGKLTELVQQISEFAFRKPASSFLKEVGRLAIKSILYSLNKSNPEKLKDLDNTIEKTIRGNAIFNDFYINFSKIYEQAFNKKGQPQLTYNLQFQLHSILEKGWNKSSNNVETWSHFIMTGNRQGLVETLVNSALYLNEESAKLCIQLAALSYDETCVLSFQKIDQIQISLFTIFQKSHLKQNDEKTADKAVSDRSANLDIRKLIEVMLLGRNNKAIRTATAHLIKGVYDQFTKERQFIKHALIEKLPLLRTKGANSLEFVALLSYIINREIETGDFQREEELYQKLCREIYKQVVRTNQSLTAHENLNIYATLSKLVPSFTLSGSQDLMIGFDDQSFKQMIESRGHQSFLEASRNSGNKISNPYMLESEACSKCFSQKPLPFQHQRAQDMKVECKFTDNRHIYKFNQAYQIKQLMVNQDQFRGNKYAKEITLYINNSQGIDLADMKNNMALWKKVKTQDAEAGQRVIIIDLTLPVTAQNILVEFTTGISSQIINTRAERQNRHHNPEGKQKIAKKKKVNIDSIDKVLGIDSVIMSLPKHIAGTIGLLSDQSNQKDVFVPGGNDYDKLMCPRCQRPIQTKNGVCNNCGENAQQCPQCRNINYDKQDAYVCTECGFSRWVKMDIQLLVQQGFACEKIENEEQKAQALQQIESNLQQAQQAYQQLMKNRLGIMHQIKKANEGSDNQRAFVSIYQDECAELYQKMMRSLNNIKSLKYEIDQFTSGASQQVEEIKIKRDDDLKPLALNRSYSAISSPEENQVQETCFSCIQEYLKGLLCFIQITAEKLSTQYKKQGFIELLYKENLKMYTHQLQDPTRRALCSLLKSDKENTEGLLKQIGQDLFNKQTIIPSHQLAQNITQETLLILDMLRVQGTLKVKEKPAENFYDLIMTHFWIILFKALVQGKTNSAIADQVAGSLIQYVREQAKASSDSKADQTQKDMNGIIVSMFDQTKRLDNQEYKMFEAAQKEQFNGKNFIIQSLLLQSSQKVRQEAKDIIQHISSNQDLHKNLLTQLLSILDQVLVLESSSSDQFFDLIQLLLTNLKDKIQPGDTTGNIYLQTFDQLLKHIDSELVKLFTQELQRKKLGADGYMPQISTGQALSRIVQLVSYMIKESSELKKRIQNNVNFVIKAFLRVKKLNLTKNKIIQNSEVEIEKMFKELHSEKEEEKANFILTCIKVIENGDCDIQEMRFLFEEICKVIDPVKPEPDYQLQFTRPRSQEEFFGGRMAKSGYTSSQFGKTMADVRIKICKETNTAEPELVELLVDNKLINLDLTVKQVYEQVHWPALYKQRNPESYDIPGIEEATQLTPMVIVYRLMGIDGEATEDRVESLQDGSEGDMDPANIQKKYGTTEILSRPFNSQQGEYETTGIQVLTQILDQFGSLVTHRYLAEWLFKLLGFALKLKSNRLELLKQRKTVDNLAKRLLESVGMQSQVENQKSATLFDVILVILELVISEVNLNDDKGIENDAVMEIDQQLENQETAKNVQIFIKILGDSCAEMVANGQGLDKTSKKIKAVSKILPFLINKEDVQAQEILIQFITEALSKIFVLDNLAEMTAKEKFVAQFNLERVIEILDSIPSSKNYLKDKLHLTQGGVILPKILSNLQSTTLADLRNEVQVYKHKLGNSYTLRFLYTFTKNHPLSQQAIFTSPLMDKLYELTQTKYKDRSLTILGNDIMQSLTNKNHHNNLEVLGYFQKLIDQAADDKKRQAQKKKEEIMRQMAAKKQAGQSFLKQMDQAQEKEGGPKCIVCQDGYTKKPTEVLGMYVFSKKLKICEMSEGGSGFISTQGYTTVTHSNFIHFTCHQNAMRADERLKIPKREWEGAIIRNEHSKCNNLYPVRGGNLRIDDYGSMVERYFQSQVKTAGNCDPDRVKVMMHDLKMIMKRLAYEDSFSRDTHGGGPEHNMHLLPFMVQMGYYVLQANPQRKPEEAEFIYMQEKRLAQFLEQGLKMKRDFLQKLEEEKKQGEIEEEEKGRESSQYGEEDDSSQSQDNAAKQNANVTSEENSGQMGDFSIDQIAFMLTSSLMFCQLPKWESYKEHFLTIILCTCANIKEESTTETKPMAGQSDFATGKKVLSIGKNDDVAMKETLPSDALLGLGSGDSAEARKRRLSSDNKSELIQKALIRVRPLLVLMRLVDAVKHLWDEKRLQVPATGLKHDAYLKRLNEEVISQGSLKEVITDCDDLFRDYKDRILKIASVEDFLQDMGLLNKIVAENQQATVAQSLEQFIMKHF